MRKALLILVSALFLVALAVPVGAQQRDPFEPQIGSGGEAGPGTQVEPQVSPGEVPPPPSDRLADTGVDPEPWLAIAFSLIAFGAGAVALARISKITSPPNS